VPRLRELQLRFAAALLDAPAEAPLAAVDPALLALVDDRGGLGPAERLEIYADMYRTRLVDVLAEDFPRVRALLGEPGFRALACRYLARHPSTRPSVRHVGGRFAGFVAVQAGTPPFLADLARLEWARVEVFDAPDAEPLRLADLEPLPASEWPALRLRLVPACRVVESAWPVQRIWEAAVAPAEGEAPGDAGARDWRPEATTIRVWREGWSVSHAAMGLTEARALRAVQEGLPFAGVCAALEGDDPDAAAREAGGLLLRWLEDQLLARAGA
jgi:hypothetical protein